MAERYPHVNKASQYCRDVVSGKIDACLYVRQCCQRHLDDLKKSRSKSYRWVFDKDKAEEAAATEKGKDSKQEKSGASSKPAEGKKPASAP